MKFTIKTTNPEKQRADCFMIPVYEGHSLSEVGKTLDRASKGHLTKILGRGDLEGELGRSLFLESLTGIPAQRLLLINVGKKETLDASHYRKILHKASSALLGFKIKDVVNYLPDLAVKNCSTPWKIRQAIEILSEHTYVFNTLKSKKPHKLSVPENMIFHAITNADKSQGEKAIREAVAIAAGMKLTKDLGNLPANICTPTYLAEQAKALSTHSKKITTTILEKKQLEKLGMNAFLAVAKGSHEPPKLITIHYQGGAKKEKPIVLVGKGITFDTGGISIKPSQSMEEMKFDMCGAAAILGVIKAAAQLKLPLNIIGIIAATENMPGGGATKPGDVVTSLSGQTIEIINTDAEGRLILSDALTYSERFNPDVVIDVATLTMGAIVALGTQAAALMSHNEALTSALIHASHYSGDRVWRMPLWEEYLEPLKSNVADIANINWSMEARTIVAGTFLSQFTKKLNWAHLDIAGIAWRFGKDKAATGRPVPLLMQYLLDRC